MKLRQRIAALLTIGVTAIFYSIFVFNASYVERNYFSDVVVRNEKCNNQETYLCRSPWWNGPKAFIPHPVLEPRCQDYLVKSLIIYVYSATYNFERRAWIRQSFEYHFTDHTAGILFVVGQQNEVDPDSESLLLKEHSQHGDILTLNVTDAYYMLGYKGLGALAWLEKCGQWPSVYCKIDDDWPAVLGNVYVVYQSFIQQPDAGDAYECSILCLWRLRRIIVHEWKRKKSWEVSINEYKEKYFPDYCYGSAATFISYRVAQRLLIASLDANVFKIDDVYITGLLRQKACVAIKDIGLANYFFNMKFPYEILF